MKRLLVGVALLAMILSAGWMIAADGEPGRDAPYRADDLWQDENGTWRVLVTDYSPSLSPRHPDHDPRGGAFVHRYGDDWRFSGKSRIERPHNASTFDVSAFWRTADGQWWLRDDSGTTYRYTANWTYDGRSITGDSPPSSTDLLEKFEGHPGDAGLDLDWVQANESGRHYGPGPNESGSAAADELVAVARGNDGFWWLLDETGTVYRFTSSGQYTGTKHAVAGTRLEPTSDGRWGHLGWAALPVAIALVAGRYRYPEKSASSLLVGSLGLWSMVALLTYGLPWPLSYVYRLPDAAIGLLLAVPLFVHLWRLDDRSIHQIGLLLALGWPVMRTILALFGWLSFH